jgi:hypothetical protein
MFFIQGKLQIAKNAFLHCAKSSRRAKKRMKSSWLRCGLGPFGSKDRLVDLSKLYLALSFVSDYFSSWLARFFKYVAFK